MQFCLRLFATGLFAATIVAGLAACGGASAEPAPLSTPVVTMPLATSPEGSEIPEATAVPPDDPFAFQCGDPSFDESTVPTLVAAWALDGDVYQCSVTVADSYQLTTPQVKAITGYAKANEQEPDTSTLAEVLAVCAARNIAAESLLQFGDRSLSRSALLLCPKAPHARLLRDVASQVVFLEGDQVVGTDVVAGTYRSEAKVRDCYWERTSKSGKRIANDFITFAASGVTVTIRKTDGSFSSERCGIWTKVR